MMAVQLETPSRIWRRIEDNEGHDMPSLPSLPAFEDSADDVHITTSESDKSEDMSEDISFPIHSTPAAQSSHTATSTIRPSSSTSSTARFAHSIASRGSRSASASGSSAANSSKRSQTSQRQEQDVSFNDISAIPSLPRHGQDHNSLEDSDLDMSELGSPRTGALQFQTNAQDDDQLSLTDALDSVSRASSPFAPEEMEPDTTQKKYYDYSVSLKSEPKPSPFGKMRNVSVRKNLPRADMRTPSLSRTTPSPSSSSSHSTPHSTRSFGHPRSRAASPLAALSVPLPPSNNASPLHATSRQEEQGDSEGAGSETEEQRSVHHQSNSDTSDMQLDMSLPEPELTDLDHEPEETHEQVQSTSEASGQDEHEPTFSSEEAPTPTSRLSGIRSPSALSTAFSSPAPSTAFTPTPAFQPRPRARFGNASPTPAHNIPSTPAAFQMNAMEEEDPATPFARRKSFLMDVINSTARPRYANPTPHPHRIAQTPAMSVMDTPVPASSNSGSGSGNGSGSAGSNETGQSSSPATSDPATARRLHAAFAGLTPGPRPRVRGGRLSHPLAQAWTASDSDDPAHSDAGSQSPYDGAGDRASFISTASSHDLTSHPRANASFDPVMGLGAGGHGVGRFNAGKLNNYLHGLNRRLQEENETLNSACVGLRRENGELREELIMLREEVEEIREEARRGGRRTSGGRRISDIGSALGGVKEDVGGEGWMEEKVAMEEELENLRSELEKRVQERNDAERRLEEEQAERSKDKDKWRERMGEVERGVEGIVRDLESRLDEAVARAQVAEETAGKFKEAEKILAELEDEKNFATERAEKAERMLESGKELGGELRQTNEKLSRAMTDLRNAQAQINHLEEELGQADDRVATIEHQLQDEQSHSKKLQDELEAKERRLDAAERRINAQENALQDVEGELQAAKDYISELEQDGEAAVERIESMEEELAAAQEKTQMTSMAEGQAHGEIARLQEESERNAELARQMEEALQAAEKQMQSDAQALSDLQSRFLSLERAQERSRVEPSHSSHNATAALDEAAEQIDALEKELDDAHKEIGRLNGALAQSPARKALEKARESRIEMLEKERDELLERVKGLKTAMVGMSTPNKFGSPGGISPMRRQLLNMNMKTPKTPGGPLKDLSWLHPSMSDPSASPYYSEIQRLQRELDRANESIDEKLDRLEDAGFGVVELTQQLEDERARNVALEEDVARLGRREERRLRRLERARCLKCRSKVDLSGLNRAAVGDESSVDISTMSMPSEPPTPPTRTSEALRQEVQSVNRQLTLMKKQWQEEKRQLLGDKAVLQDAANRLNLQVQDAQQRAAHLEKAGEKARAGIQVDLDQAKRVIADLEEDLKEERTRLRTLNTEQNRVEREKAEVLIQLRRTETDMDEVKHQLQRLKRDNDELEAELRETATAEQKARILEAKASANVEMINQLRQERSMLAADHKALQKRFSEVTQHMRQLRDEQAASQHSHDSRRHELDLRLLEIDDLKRELAERTAALHAAQAETRHETSSHAADQRALAALEADLARVRKNAEALGRDLRKEQQRRDRSEEERRKERESARGVKKELERIRREVEKVERGRKQATAEVRVLRERVGALEGEKGAWEGHVCAADQDGLVALREQHKREAKGLILQISYLKAKFTRETNFCTDLAQQKKYLLLLLARHERGDAKILAMIARIGFPIAPPEPPKPRRRTLKIVVRAVMFFGRVQRLSEQWRKHGEQKAAITAALHEVRRRRVQGPKDELASGHQHQPQQRMRVPSGRRS